MDDPMGEKSSISCRVRATFRLSESTNLIRFLVCVLFPVVVFFLLPERRYVDLVVLEVLQVKSFNIKGGECVVVPAFGGIAFVILSRDIFFLHILYIWLEILLTDDCSFEVAI